MLIYVNVCFLLSKAHVYSEGNNVYDVMLNQVKPLIDIADLLDDVSVALIPLLFDFADKSSV